MQHIRISRRSGRTVTCWLSPHVSCSLCRQAIVARQLHTAVVNGSGALFLCMAVANILQDVGSVFLPVVASMCPGGALNMHAALTL